MAAEMKVEIDLNDIMGDEYGAETLQESVRRQVIEQLTDTLKKGIGEQVNREVSRILNEEIRAAVQPRMEQIVQDLLNAEYVTVDRYGDRSKSPTTFRKELVRAIHEHMKYEKRQWDNEKNAFTKAVDEVIAQHVKTFKEDFTKHVDSEFTREAMNFATKKLREKLGITA